MSAGEIVIAVLLCVLIYLQIRTHALISDQTERQIRMLDGIKQILR